MDVDKPTTRRMLWETAEAILEEVKEIEESLAASSMIPGAELLWFGEKRQDKINHLRWAAARMIHSAKTL